MSMGVDKEINLLKMWHTKTCILYISLYVNLFWIVESLCPPLQITSFPFSIFTSFLILMLLLYQHIQQVKYFLLKQVMTTFHAT